MLLNWLAVICILIPQPTQIAVTQVPDFSGTWKINRNTSTYSGLKDLEDLTFVITQHPPVLDVKRIIREKKHRERISELTYYTDGRGEKVSFLFSDQKWNSKTICVNSEIVSTFTVPQYESLTSDFTYYDYNEVWSLSRDGKLMTITTNIRVRNVPDSLRSRIRNQTYQKVFRRTE